MITLYSCTITDSVTSLNLFSGGQDYDLISFATVIASLQTSQLAGTGPYQNVQQPIELDIFGDTPSACWDNATRLVRLLSQGHYWQQDMPVNPVRIVIKTALDAPEVEAYILGQVGDDNLMQLDPEPTVTAQGSRFALRGVQVAFVRSGAWETQVEASVTSSTATPPAAMTAAFATNSRTYSRIRFAGSRASGSGDGGFVRDNVYGFVLFASDDAKFYLLDSATMSTPALTSTVVDTVNDAYGGSVKRCQASTTEINVTYPIGWATPKRRVGIFAAVRNNSASVSFFLRGEVTDESGTPNRTPYIEIDTSTTLPRIVYLGLVTARYDVTLAENFSIYVSATTTSGAHTLDIDYVVLHCLDDVWSDRQISIGNTLSASGEHVNPLVIEPGSSIQRTPYPLVVTTLISAGSHVLMPRGDTYLVGTGQEIAAMVLTTNGNAAWRLRSSVANIDPTAFTLRRSRAYLTPPGATEP